MRSTLAAVSVGGVLGALSRFGIGEVFPVAAGTFPWSTLAVNLSGCLLIGVLMTWLAANPAPQWIRPLLGVGFLGGYTTFSAYAVEAGRLLLDGRTFLGVTYLLATALGALAAVYAGSALVRGLRRRRGAQAC